ncbi:MAG: decarboxylating NADP(+)-dependent phosphogluconate dehydrogenase [Victivallales bacterium]|nr:decarboxylating NADP(+)-dependent phosphogluconate dehydrogenase [Victivallales bacterium]MCF7889380.1 decarboxylating NADP(+)-dependent phosphogluconate dehydrogenase [Victivallales bacterium]
MTKKADIGFVGLAVMGENLVLNMESKGFTVAVFNRTTEKVDKFVGGRGKGKKIIGCHSIETLCKNLEKPRKIMIMVKAGNPVDKIIKTALPYLEEGDIIIDGGNSHFSDSVRRTGDLAERGILFVGTGISGGEEGALKGPSIMPGGAPEAWPHVKPVFQAVAAKAPDGSPCCEWVGKEGAGHFVKMVHNGIEYGDMQMICEAYNLMKNILGLTPEELHSVFDNWNKGELDSYLIEITRDIFKEKDPETGKYVIDIVLDTAGQKGTGKWTGESGLDLGIAIPTIAEAVFARCVSAVKEERVEASKVLKGPGTVFEGNKKEFIEDIRKALYASKICSYAQGYQLMRAAAHEYGWKLNYGEIALMWRSGCIIRAKFLGDIKSAFNKKPDLANLLLDPFFNNIIEGCQASWRKVVAKALELGVPVPAFSSALCYYDSYRSAVLPANLLQSQRDYFGAHTYERIDRPRGQFFHTDWCKLGGTTTSSTYEV